MIKRLIPLGQLVCILFLLNHSILAQVPQVASRIQFGGMELQLTEQARRDIQSSVDALYRSEKHFNLMLERVDLYMPVIEPILLEHGVPAEFKYLVIQESALIPDAVSSSNAVGYWQFKEASATELGLRVDRQVDERMNIISATEGAAKYLLRSNAEFDNWVYSLQSYLMGQGGASRSVNKRHYGARHMKIDGDTHWYVKKFLSHLVAFEGVIGKQSRSMVLYPYNTTQNKSLSQIAYEFDADEDELLAYNKWLKTSRIPDDKPYTVIIPLNIDESEDLLAEADGKVNDGTAEQGDNLAFGNKQQHPEKPASPKDKLVVVEMNDLKGVVARPGDHVRSLAAVGNISEKRFRKFNDLGPRDAIQPGQFYYLQKKRRKARVYEHVLQPGETMWDLAQRYGVRLRKLRQKNRMESHEQARAGRVIWLRFIRPASEPIEYRPVKEPKEPLYASTKEPAEATVQPEPTPAPAIEKAAEKTSSTTTPQKPAANEHQEASPAATDTISSSSSKGDPVTEPEVEAAGQQDSEPQKEPSDSLSGAGPANLYPADTPVSQQRPVQEKSPETRETIKDVQKDTLIRQNEARNIPPENKEKSLYPGESAPLEEEVPLEEEAPEQEEASADSFATDTPVNFIEEEAEAPQEETKTLHEVQAGETLYALSRKYGISVQDLIRWNQLPDQPVLNIGQQLRISPSDGAAPVAEELASETQADTATETQTEAAPSEQNGRYRYHEVSAGESMYRVARMYNVTIKDIMQWNNKDNFDLREGEQLIVGTDAE